MNILLIGEIPQPYELFRCAEANEERAALLESVEGPQTRSRYSIVAWGSRAYLQITGSGEVTGDISGSVGSLSTIMTDLVSRSPKLNVPTHFKGGALGYLSYDAVRHWERIRELSRPWENWPDGEFFVPANLAVYDHVNGKVYVEGEVPRCGQISIGTVNFSKLDETMSDGEYINAVKKILEYIREGYVFQTVPSKGYRYVWKGDLTSLYYKLRQVNPSPYMFYLKFGKRTLLGSSPETLFRTTEGTVESYPIAGTRPRGNSAVEDLRLEQELLASEKERAEHLMLVDLARNDLGKVSVPGSVTVPELMYVEKYSHVQHIVSKVVGTLKRNLTSMDVMRATFPAGTVTGAPKPMAMNLIEQLETARRGPYAGAVGYVSTEGNSQFAITIRSAFVNGEVFRIQAGGGIVYDSSPEGELQEVKYKLKALTVSMGV
ncbi:anthranilate synthase component I [Sulfodiicoccus acidiphilus]|uniref:anthranilate synthase n=1 Tax=Sulfodiicoccus acidiphilus TaxID=1670455 RepID=A0A348B3F2_9CREN|nr:anthranilate synthase component I [Sulfodiicoccus acidiphilus]BBD72704.1 anthranilate synthase component I [Sulfodiicoccus acidiphilus]GGT95395.1 anthranilate synthase component I [Sulfodiicoccus acidiphilus]